MSQSQLLESASNLYAALRSGDREMLRALLHQDFVGHTTPGLPLELGGTYQGGAAMGRDFWGRIGKNFAVKAKPEKYSYLADGALLVEGTYEGRAVGGTEFTAEFIHILTFTEGQIVGLRQLTDSQRWNEALRGSAAPSDESKLLDGRGVGQTSAEVKRADGNAMTDAREYSRLTYESDNGLVTVTLDRAEARNAIDFEMAQELFQVATRLAEEPNLRTVHLRANGPIFTVGGDVDAFGESTAGGLSKLLRRMTGPYHDALAILARLKAPIVCEVNGAAAGGGLGLLYISDVVIAGSSAKFATGFSALGLSADGANSWYLPKLVGPRRAAEMLFEHRVLTASEAVEWNLISREVPDELLPREALQTAQRIAAGPTVGMGHMRALLHRSWTTALSEQLADESEALAISARTSDASNAISNFRTKKSITFEGK